MCFSYKDSMCCLWTNIENKWKMKWQLQSTEHGENTERRRTLQGNESHGPKPHIISFFKTCSIWLLPSLPLEPYRIYHVYSYCIITIPFIVPLLQNNTIHPQNCLSRINISHNKPGLAHTVITWRCLWTELYLQLSQHSQYDPGFNLWAWIPGECKVIKRRALPSAKTTNTTSIQFTVGGTNGSWGQLGTTTGALS